MSLTNAQAFTLLIKLGRKSPEAAEAAEAVMDYIAELTAVASLADSNLRDAARKLPDSVTAHNSRVVSEKLERLIEQSPSHGGDI